ncbi:MAG: DUF2341 domain-containing protein [bacterium]|nr:DUF2341 domain-containing protein [bacterium]
MGVHKYIRIIITVILLICCQNSTYANWWDASWPYRRAIIVDNSLNSDTLWNYPVKFTVDYETTMSPDFSDIRFIGCDSSSLLSYWIQGYAIGDSAIVWVKVPVIPALDIMKFYMYYGNSTASYVGIPDSVFDFFDDFSTNPNSNNKWEIHRYSADVTNEGWWDSANKNWYLTTAVYNKGFAAFCNYALQTLSWKMDFAYKDGGGAGADGIVAMFYKNKGAYGSPAYGGYLGFTLSNLTPVIGYGIEFDNWYNTWDNTSNHIAVMKDTYSNHLTSIGDMRTEDNLWHNVTVTFIKGKTLVEVDKDTVINYTISSPVYTYKGVGFSSSTGSAGNNNQIIDNVIVRQYSSPEPSTIPGPEEIMGIETSLSNSTSNRLLKVYSYNNVVHKNVTFLFNLEGNGYLSLNVYNLSGEKIMTLINNVHYSNGRHQIEWDKTNNKGERIGCGLYFYVLEMKKENGNVDRTVNKIIIL